jgi:hypothetical protein
MGRVYILFYFCMPNFGDFLSVQCVAVIEVFVFVRAAAPCLAVGCRLSAIVGIRGRFCTDIYCAVLCFVLLCDVRYL